VIYDRRRDPYELRNLAADLRFTAVKGLLAQRLHALAAS
jgi:hypothetical protein